MEILPDVKSLEDILVHSMAGWFKHALLAHLKYLECLSCCKGVRPLSKPDRQSEITEGMHLADSLWINQFFSDREAKIRPMNTVSTVEVCATASIEWDRGMHAQTHMHALSVVSCRKSRTSSLQKEIYLRIKGLRRTPFIRTQCYLTSLFLQQKCFEVAVKEVIH